MKTRTRNMNIKFDKIKKILMIIKEKIKNHKFECFRRNSYPRKNYPIEFSVEYGSVENSLSFKHGEELVELTYCESKRPIPIFTIGDDSDFEELGLLDDEESYLAMSDDD